MQCFGVYCFWSKVYFVAGHLIHSIQHSCSGGKINLWLVTADGVCATGDLSFGNVRG